MKTLQIIRVTLRATLHTPIWKPQDYTIFVHKVSRSHIKGWKGLPGKSGLRVIVSELKRSHLLTSSCCISETCEAQYSICSASLPQSWLRQTRMKFYPTLIEMNEIHGEFHWWHVAATSPGCSWSNSQRKLQQPFPAGGTNYKWGPEATGQLLAIFDTCRLWKMFYTWNDWWVFTLSW